MMRNRNYFGEIGMDIADIGKNLDIVSSKIFTFHCMEDQEDCLFKTKTRKGKYRIVSQQKKTQSADSCRA